MSVAGLPPELDELLWRLRGRGLAVSPLEIGRLQHLLALTGTLAAGPDADPLLALLAAVLCKDEPQRDLLRREYRVWAAEHLCVPVQPDAADAAPEGTADPFGAGPLLDGRARAAARRPWRGRLHRGWPWALAGAAVFLVLGAGAWWWIAGRTPPAPAPVSTSAGPAAAVPTGSLCPQDLPTASAPEVWAWVPVADDRPWVALGGGLLLFGLLGGAAWRLWAAPRRWRPRSNADPGADQTPRRGLPPRPVHGDLLLDPGARRELVWSIERYVSEDPDRALDPEATVAASARAAGVPHLVQHRRAFPRQVWLWCDRKGANPELQERLVLEVRRALERANLPVRLARFHGLPGRLTWEDNREPFAPGVQEGAGAQALVVVLTDGVALVQAWENPGERPRLAPLLRDLRAWPRLLLVDLGDGDLTRLAAGWRLPVRGGEGLAAWLADARAGADAASPPRPPPDPAQLDLWAAACLLAPQRSDQAEAERLRRAMGLRPGPFDYRPLTARLDQCARAPALAADLIDRLARSQGRDAAGLPVGDGYFTRALAFWDQRLADAYDQLGDDPAAQARVRLARARLQLWRDPAGAAAALAGIGGERNGQLIRAALAGVAPAPGPAPARGPTWDWQRLPVAARWRLRGLGLGGRTPVQYGLRRGARHHLALALLAGVAIGGLGWGLGRLLWPHDGGAAVFADPRFTGQVLAVPAPGRTWLGSPWRLTALAALGPLDTPHTWDWRAAPNPEFLGERGAIFTGGTRAFPIRACTVGWPRRALAVIAADQQDPGARQLAIRLLDRGAADRVLIAADWAARLGGLTQGVSLPDDQLIVFLPPAAGEGGGDERPVSAPGPDAADPVAALAADFAALAEVRGGFAGLAGALDFPGAHSVKYAWPAAATRVLAGAPQVSGGPEVRTDGFGVVWVSVCGGTFLMGTSASEDAYLEQYAQAYFDAWGGNLEQRRKDAPRGFEVERPVHPVLVAPFEIARTELTQGQDRAAGGPATGEAMLPLAKLDHAAAAAACTRLASAQPGDGLQVGLASEAQWEFAARAGTAAPWSSGEDDSRLGDYAWLKGNANGRAHPVGEKVPNALCLADMHGNLWERVGDCYDAAAYRSRAPLAIDPFVDQSGCALRVLRGGSFALLPALLRSADRFDVRPDGGYGAVGLRCVRSRARRH